MNINTAQKLIDALVANAGAGGQQAILVRQHNDDPMLFVAELTEVGARDWHESGVGYSVEEALDALAKNLPKAE